MAECESCLPAHHGVAQHDPQTRLCTVPGCTCRGWVFLVPHTEICPFCKQRRSTSHPRNCRANRYRPA